MKYISIVNILCEPCMHRLDKLLIFVFLTHQFADRIGYNYMQIEIVRYDEHMYNRLSYGGTHRKLHKTIMFLYIFIDHKTLNVLHLIQ